MSALTTEMRDDGVAVVTFDLAGESVNKLSREVIDEFRLLMDRVDTDSSVRAIVLISGKRDLFIAGADIEQFLELRTAAEAEAMSREGQEMVARIDESVSTRSMRRRNSSITSRLSLFTDSPARSNVTTATPSSRISVVSAVMSRSPAPSR
ncbi:MAG: enoyl-CoA hydratase-related protein, partial [Gemmatimonadales bacterium]